VTEAAERLLQSVEQDALSAAQVLSDAWLPGNLVPKVVDLLLRFCQAQRVTAIKTGRDIMAAC
jgi:hypothetical protein